MSMEMDSSMTSTGEASINAEHKVPYKSWKKKYRKLRHKFDGVMKRSDELFKEDLIATAAIKRITEENNRLLDLLIDLNSNAHIPREFHQYIGSPSSASPTRFMSPDTLEEFSKREFFIEEELPSDAIMSEDDAIPEPPVPVEAEPMELDDDDLKLLATVNGDDTKEDGEEREGDEEAHQPAPEPTKRKPRTIRRQISPPVEPTYTKGQTPARFRETSPFLNPIEDEELPPGTIVHYHDATTTTNGASPSATKFSTSNGSVTGATDEEHHWPRNPMSVYCWLRKYQPQVFLQDSESGTKRRGRAGKNANAEDEDDHGSVTEAAPAKAKRGSKATDGKAAAGAKRRRKTLDDGDDTEREKPVRGGGARRPAAKRPRVSKSSATNVKEEQ